MDFKLGPFAGMDRQWGTDNAFQVFQTKLRSPSTTYSAVRRQKWMRSNWNSPVEFLVWLEQWIFMAWIRTWIWVNNGLCCQLAHTHTRRRRSAVFSFPILYRHLRDLFVVLWPGSAARFSEKRYSGFLSKQSFQHSIGKDWSTAKLGGEANKSWGNPRNINQVVSFPPSGSIVIWMKTPTPNDVHPLNLQLMFFVEKAHGHV